MDEEDIRLDIAEALGKANAFLAIQMVLIGMLVGKSVLSADDAATISGVANEVLRQMEGLSEEVRGLAQSAVRGYAKTWTTHVTKN